jgi:signal transduction histidine kinase
VSEDPLERRRRLRHDLRTPLTVVSGFAEVLAAEKPVADEDRRDYAVSYAKLRALGFETEVAIEEGLDELLRGVDLLSGRGPYGEA